MFSFVPIILHIIVDMLFKAKPDTHVEAKTESHDVVNPGPPVTLDYMPIPFQKYKTVHSELQSKFNRYLAIGAALFAVSLYLVSIPLILCSFSNNSKG